MNELNSGSRRPASAAARVAAFCVHLLTALGAGLALLAMMEAVREHWAAMFGWLGAALLVDALDGPLARRFDVERLQPDWSGETLDLVVDFTTYVFVPAYAIASSRLLLPVAGPLLGVAIVMSGALYFADRRMKTEDNHFRGFPALWNAAAFYLFLLQPAPWVASAAMAFLIALTFAPFHVLHPVRVVRLRQFNLALIALWSALGIWTLMKDFQVSWPVTATLCAIAVHVMFGNAVLQRMTQGR